VDILPLARAPAKPGRPIVRTQPKSKAVVGAEVAWVTDNPSSVFVDG
jgi:hypothetical protein